MKLQFLPGGPTDSHMLRLFDFSAGEAAGLQRDIQKLLDGEITALEIHRLPFVQLLSEIELTAVLDDRLRDPETEYAILGGPTTTSFIWRGTCEEWKRTIEQLAPMTQSCSSDDYAWMTEDLGVMLLVSPSGSW